ncbi:MAG: BrnT family toxin [Thermoanaerobaculia bacterium]
MASSPRQVSTWKVGGSYGEVLDSWLKGGTLGGVDFEWDPKKAARNLQRHRVSFTEATTVFGDPLGITVPDPGHSTAENRQLTIGRSVRGRLLIVANTERGARLRIINARELTRHEREAYEETITGRNE